MYLLNKNKEITQGLSVVANEDYKNKTSKKDQKRLWGKQDFKAGVQNNQENLTFIDLFSGIGGFRVGFEKAGFKCIYSCEIDEHARKVYKENFKEDPLCDITKLNPKDLPDFDILLAGFPCQSFSICGRQRGFYDSTRGTLFFDICRILENKKPSAFILENVRNLETHDKGKTLTIILDSLHSLGYSVSYRVLNAKDFGVPQNRERIIIIGNKDGYVFDFDKLEKNETNSMVPFLDKNGDFEYLKKEDYTLIEEKHVKRQKSGLIFVGYRNKKIRTNGVRKGTIHLSRVHKQPNRIYSSEGTHPTIASQEQSGRYWILTPDKRVRKLTLNECFRFMGFPENFKKIGITSKLYERIGNSVCVNMVYAIAKEIKVQFFLGGGNMNNDKTRQFLEKNYNEAISIKAIDEIGLSSEQLEWINTIVEYEENMKGVFTVIFTSLVYKSLNPNQDVRLHQANLPNGYSGRSFDTKYITPFLKQKRFYGAMKESGWLTRSLEQNRPYTMDYQGKIRIKKVKTAFLKILDDIEENNADPNKYLKVLINRSVTEKNKKAVVLVNPIVKESKSSIKDIIYFLNEHFYYPYKHAGASILPVIAIYSIYQCIIEELKRFKEKELDKLASHTSCDKSSGATGYIVVRNKSDNELYEVVEVKFEIPIDTIMIKDAYKKFSPTKIQRYYILSTESIKDDENESCHKAINDIRNKHGCQVIINGVFPTLRYYLRLLENVDIFLDKYLNNLKVNTEVKQEHKVAWNTIMKNSH